MVVDTIKVSKLTPKQTLRREKALLPLPETWTSQYCLHVLHPERQPKSTNG